MRARNIKPGFFKNEQLAECSAFARLLFPGLWLVADRNGCLEYRPKRWKAEIFPYDLVDCASLFLELEKNGLVLRYSVNGNEYIFIPKFKDHQNPHKNEPESGIPVYKTLNEINVEAVRTEHSSNYASAPVMQQPRPADSLIPDSLIPDSLILNTNTPPYPPEGECVSKALEEINLVSLETYSSPESNLSEVYIQREPADTKQVSVDCGERHVAKTGTCEPGGKCKERDALGSGRKRSTKRVPKGADLPPYSEEFESVWEFYPRKVNKGEAWRVYRELQEAGQLPDDMRKRVEYRSLDADWKDSDRIQYVPHMTTWLHRRGWEDEGCLPCAPDPRNTPEDERRNEIMGQFNFGMPEPGETREQSLDKNRRMEAALDAEGL